MQYIILIKKNYFSSSVLFCLVLKKISKISSDPSSFYKTKFKFIQKYSIFLTIFGFLIDLWFYFGPIWI